MTCAWRKIFGGADIVGIEPVEPESEGHGAMDREAGASLGPGEGGGYHILEHKSRHRTQDDKREKGETDG